MAIKNNLTNLAQRLADFAATFDDRTRREWQRQRRSGNKSWLENAYWDLHDLFARDLSSAALRDLVRKDARETFRFFTREIDFESLKNLPWHRRYPRIGWHTFLALAHRMNPARRIGFAVATLSFFAGIFFFLRNGPRTFEGGLLGSGIFWWVISIFLVFVLLLMELKDKLDLKGDLEIAREIQFGLIPARPVLRHGMMIHCLMRPANTVGGDYCDVIDLDDDRVAVVIGDVAGKGMPAALLMALLQGSLRTLLTAGLRAPHVVRELNRYLFASIPPNRLVTLFYGELNTLTGEMHYVNAGHNPPLWIAADGSIERLTTTSIVMGVTANPDLAVLKIRLAAGDRLFLYTDGITEAFNDREEEYGDSRLQQYLAAHIKEPQDSLMDGLMADVLAFCEDNRPLDDMTLVSIFHHAAAAGTPGQAAR